jgi:hypothetical protein
MDDGFHAAATPDHRAHQYISSGFAVLFFSGAVTCAPADQPLISRLGIIVHRVCGAGLKRVRVASVQQRARRAAASEASCQSYRNRSLPNNSQCHHTFLQSPIFERRDSIPLPLAFYLIKQQNAGKLRSLSVERYLAAMWAIPPCMDPTGERQLGPGDRAMPDEDALRLTQPCLAQARRGRSPSK